jgi:hypothetical protein
VGNLYIPEAGDPADGWSGWPAASTEVVRAGFLVFGASERRADKGGLLGEHGERGMRIGGWRRVAAFATSGHRARSRGMRGARVGSDGGGGWLEVDASGRRVVGFAEFSQRTPLGRRRCCTAHWRKETPCSACGHANARRRCCWAAKLQERDPMRCMQACRCEAALLGCQLQEADPRRCMRACEREASALGGEAVRA